jgi:ribosomal protein S18
MAVIPGLDHLGRYFAREAKVVPRRLQATTALVVREVALALASGMT